MSPIQGDVVRAAAPGETEQIDSVIRGSLATAPFPIVMAFADTNRSMDSSAVIRLLPLLQLHRLLLHRLLLHRLLPRQKLHQSVLVTALENIMHGISVRPSHGVPLLLVIEHITTMVPGLSVVTRSLTITKSVPWSKVSALPLLKLFRILLLFASLRSQ